MVHGVFMSNARTHTYTQHWLSKWGVRSCCENWQLTWLFDVRCDKAAVGIWLLDYPHLMSNLKFICLLLSNQRLACWGISNVIFDLFYVVVIVNFLSTTCLGSLSNNVINMFLIQINTVILSLDLIVMARSGSSLCHGVCQNA